MVRGHDAAQGYDEHMKPSDPVTDVLERAQAGDTVRISLRGPHTQAELEEVEQAHEAEWPGINFEFTWDDGPIEVRSEAHG